MNNNSLALIQPKTPPARDAKNLAHLEGHLYRTPWSKGGQVMSTRGESRTVASWPGARPAQVRAAAKKLLDVLRANARKA